MRLTALGIGTAIALAITVWNAGYRASTAQDDASATFVRIASVLQSPRCLNCHTVTEFPRQGDDRHPHLWGVSRGADDRGWPHGRCISCHASTNNNGAGIPGRPDWHLAPLSMGWEGLSPTELCLVLLDPVRNGNRSAAQIADHIAHDHQFVAWAWEPGRNPSGADRTVPPISRDDLVKLVDQWVSAGAQCRP